MLPIKQESADNKRKPQPQQNKPTAFTVGSRVTVDILGTNRVGTIKWIGGSNPLKPWAGIEMVLKQMNILNSIEPMLK